jgi:hypothetical protein
LLAVASQTDKDNLFQTLMHLLAVILKNSIDYDVHSFFLADDSHPDRMGKVSEYTIWLRVMGTITH